MNNKLKLLIIFPTILLMFANCTGIHKSLLTKQTITNDISAPLNPDVRISIKNCTLSEIIIGGAPGALIEPKSLRQQLYKELTNMGFNNVGVNPDSADYYIDAHISIDMVSKYLPLIIFQNVLLTPPAILLPIPLHMVFTSKVSVSLLDKENNLECLKVDHTGWIERGYSVWGFLGVVKGNGLDKRAKLIASMCAKMINASENKRRLEKS